MGLTSEKYLKVIHVDDLINTGWIYQSGPIVEKSPNNFGGLKTLYGVSGHYVTWFKHPNYPELQLAYFRSTFTLWKVANGDHGKIEDGENAQKLDEYLERNYPKIPRIERLKNELRI